MGVVVEDASGSRSIITAAHCVPFSAARGAGNIVGLVEVSAFGSSKAKPLRACLVAWEPCTDIAVLGLETLSGTLSPDYQPLNKFLTDCTAAPLCLDVASLGRRFGVQICQHTGEWIRGVVSIYDTDNPHFLFTEFPKSQSIKSGTSGSPAFNRDGHVIGVVSFTIDLDGVPRTTGGLTCLAAALPGWMLDNFRNTGP